MYLRINHDFFMIFIITIIEIIFFYCKVEYDFLIKKWVFSFKKLNKDDVKKYFNYSTKEDFFVSGLL